MMHVNYRRFFPLPKTELLSFVPFKSITRLIPRPAPFRATRHVSKHPYSIVIIFWLKVFRTSQTPFNIKERLPMTISSRMIMSRHGPPLITFPIMQGIVVEGEVKPLRRTSMKNYCCH